MAKVEILTGAERQRRWSTELKLSILQEAFSADGTVSDVARRHDVLPQQIYAWRKKLLPPESPQTASFIPVSLSLGLAGRYWTAHCWRDITVLTRVDRREAPVLPNIEARCVLMVLEATPRASAIFATVSRSIVACRTLTSAGVSA